MTRSDGREFWREQWLGHILADPARRLTDHENLRYVELVLIEKKRRPDEDPYRWTPFEHDDRFNPNWWEDPFFDRDGYRYVQALLDGFEVARVELDDTIDASEYTGSLGTDALEIQFIEVAADRRRQGIATEVVRRLTIANRDRRLVAFSEEADEFWSSLGWVRYEHCPDSRGYRPLFVQARDITTC